MRSFWGIIQVILGLLSFLVANAAVALSAQSLLRRVGTGQGHVDTVLFLLIRLALVSTAVLVGGVTGCLSPAPMGLVGLSVVAALLLRGEHRRLTRLTFPKAGGPMTVLAAVIFLRLLGQVWFFSPHNYDAVAYHLPKVGEWVRAGAFTREMGVDTHVTFPAGFELIETWWVVFLHHDVLIEMAGVEFLLLACAATYGLARHLGFSEKAASAAAVFYAMTPALLLQATSCLNDAPVAALVLVTTLLILVRAPNSLLLLALGVGMGMKPTYFYTLPGLALLWWLSGRGRPNSPGLNRSMLALAAIGLALGSFWYARNLLWYGNPIYPVGTQGLVGMSGKHRIQFGPGPSSLIHNAKSLVDERLYDRTRPYGALTNRISGWGPLAFATGFAALLLELRSDRRLRKLAFCWLVSMGSVLILVMHDDWYMRFVLFFPALLCIAVARLVEVVPATNVIVWLSLALQFIGTMLSYDLQSQDFQILSRQGWRDRSMAEVFGVRIPEDAVGYFVDDRNLAYLLYKPDFSRRVVYLRAKTSSELISEMRQAHIRVLYAVPTSSELLEIVSDCERTGLLQWRSEHTYVLQ